MTKRYHHKGLFQKVQRYVQHCDLCQRKTSLKKANKPLHPIPVGNEAFNRIGMDVVGPLEETQNGKPVTIPKAFVTLIKKLKEFIDLYSPIKPDLHEADDIKI